MKPARVIYEVTLVIDRERIEEFDMWLPGHVREMLSLPHFVSAQRFEGEDDDGRPLRCVHYRSGDRETLQAYFDQHADAMRADGVRRFGGAMRASRRILEEVGD